MTIDTKIKCLRRKERCHEIICGYQKNCNQHFTLSPGPYNINFNACLKDTNGAYWLKCC